MPDPGRTPASELQHSRDRFSAELWSRIEALRESVHRINQAENPTAEVYALKRRLHALGHAARVLGFERAADALDGAEASLSEGTGVGAATNARLQAVSATPALIAELDHVLDGLPTLLLGGQVAPLGSGDATRRALSPAPLCLLVLGDAAVLDGVREPNDPWSSLLELHTETDSDALVHAAERLGPDVILLHGEARLIAAAVPSLLGAAPAARLVACTRFERHAELATLIERGVARVLPEPCAASVLRRVLRQVSLREPPARRPGSDAFRRVTATELAQLIGDEARRVLVPAPGRPAPNLDLGSGSELLAELWSTLARVRALCEQQAPSDLGPASEGPEGALVVAPGSEPDPARDAEARRALSERRILIASADGELAHFLAEELEATGAVALRAADGASALALARRTWPEAVVADMRLPELDGFALCRRLKRDLALADVPLLLLGWRTELSELARRAQSARAAAAPGAQALHGAFAPLGLLRDIARAIEPRRRLEQRLAESGVVHGRLDGVSVRSLLQLACRRGEDGSLRVENAGLVFELGLEAGQLVRAELRDGAEEARGEAVLGPLLAARGARYRFEPARTPGPHDFDGELLGLLEPALRRSRAVDRVLSERPLAELERLVLDPHAVTQCAFQGSSAVRSLLTQLVDGVPPRALTLKSYATREPLEQVIAATLDDLSLGGAVLAVLDAVGDDLVARELEQASDVRPRSGAPEPPRLVPIETVSIPPEPAEDEREQAPTERPPAAVAGEPEPEPAAPTPPPPARSRRRSHAPDDFELGDAVLAALASPASSTPPGTRFTAATASDDDDIDDAWGTPPGPPISPFTGTESETGSGSGTGTGTETEAENGTGAGAETESGSETGRVTATETEAAAMPVPQREPAAGDARAARLATITVSATLSVPVPHEVTVTELSSGSTPPPEPASVPAPVPASLSLPVPEPVPAPVPLSLPVPEPVPAPVSEIALPRRIARVVAPVAITIAAGVTAFFGLSKLGIGARDDRVQNMTTIQAQLPIAARPVTAPSVDAGAPALQNVNAKVELASEELAVPADVKLKPGHGLLEIQTWRRQRLYVDGVFVGNYAARRVPLNAGSYEVRLLDGAREIKREVQVTAGQRTLLSVSKQTTP